MFCILHRSVSTYPYVYTYAKNHTSYLADIVTNLLNLLPSFDQRGRLPRGVIMHPIWRLNSGQRPPSVQCGHCGSEREDQKHPVHRWGNWSGGGLYSPSAELISQALTSDSEHWRVITIPVAEDQLPHFTPFTIRTGATKAFCQFPGPVGACIAQPLSCLNTLAHQRQIFLTVALTLSGCWIEPLEPTANMTRSWDNSSAISTEITYT